MIFEPVVPFRAARAARALRLKPRVARDGQRARQVIIAGDDQRFLASLFLQDGPCVSDVFLRVRAVRVADDMFLAQALRDEHSPHHIPLRSGFLSALPAGDHHVAGMLFIVFLGLIQPPAQLHGRFARWQHLRAQHDDAVVIRRLRHVDLPIIHQTDQRGIAHHAGHNQPHKRQQRLDRPAAFFPCVLHALCLLFLSFFHQFGPDKRFAVRIGHAGEQPVLAPLARNQPAAGHAQRLPAGYDDVVRHRHAQ